MLPITADLCHHISQNYVDKSGQYRQLCLHTVGTPMLGEACHRNTNNYGFCIILSIIMETRHQDNHSDGHTS
jgi:hypothetical protein